MDLSEHWNKYLELSDYSKKLIEKCCGPRVIDLLLYFPSNVIEYTDNLQYALDNKAYFNVELTVQDYSISAIKSRPIRITCESQIGIIYLVFFNGKAGYIKKLFPIGQKIAVSGLVQKFGNLLQIMHPIRIANNRIESYKLETVYPSISNLSSDFIKLQIKRLLQSLSHEAIPEWIPENLLRKFSWTSLLKSVYSIHNPKMVADISEFSRFRTRIAFDEMLANQICINNIRNKIAYSTGCAFPRNNIFLDKIKLPFKLTQDQEQVLNDIFIDLEKASPMNRLIQGDVGSGKTIVAFLAALNVVSHNAQVVFIAPTEVLATQHFETLKTIIPPHINIDLIISKNRNIRKSQINCLEHGLVHIAIGTHALLEENIKFKNLGLAIIDEQQRFGVSQRLKLLQKGEHTNALYLSATPIPRTLILSVFGDLDVSIIAHKPANRQTINTAIISKKKIFDLIERIKQYDQQVYWICPLIEESETKQMTAAINRYNFLKEKLGSVGLLHGKLKSADKEKILADFKENKFKVLVSTTVIEVGIDIPNANIIVIENAENFGLAQLHQLRGRVGRSDSQAFCILIYGDEISQAGIERLNILKKTDDGFALSEADMKMRGYGNILGTEQSGFQAFKYCDITQHQDLLLLARDIAKNTNDNYKALLEIYDKQSDIILM